MNLYGTHKFMYNNNNSLVSMFDKSQPSTEYFYKDNKIIKTIHYANGLCEYCPNRVETEIYSTEYLDYFENGLVKTSTYIYNIPMNKKIKNPSTTKYKYKFY